MLSPLRSRATDEDKQAQYAAVLRAVDALLEGEDDLIAAMATVVAELHHAFEDFHWTGFYRVTAPELLVIGPYQGGHGCLRIPFARGVCGSAARTQTTQIVPDVEAFPGHIACSSTTRSEIVVPVMTHGPSPRLVAVFDVDSDLPAAFTEADRLGLLPLMQRVGAIAAVRVS